MILIVEDEPLIAMAYRLVAMECGLQVSQSAEDSVTALRLARANPPAIAIIDLRLADGPTGDRLALTLHAELGVVPLFVTGTPDLLSDAAKSIAAAVLVKPVSHERLSRVLLATAQCLADRRVEEAVA
ncbi:response regulator [Arenibaculum pallidiluteum]|uniref:response regulator n=1 Tax=Arenibaculum pallidiluteum TaxID=2812559 RepID=UPI001A966EB3|nr:response regulator [Arenibaculum pallidiluteum]